MSATIKDIAKRLNISTSTVSYALNNGPRRVPDLVKDEVLRVAKELNYRPNRVARSLVTRRTQTLGVLPTEAAMNLALAPHFQLCLNGVFNQAEVIDHDVLVYSRFAPGVLMTQNIVDTVSDGRVDGVILVAPFIGAPFIEQLQSRGFPFVVLNADIPDATCMTCDNVEGVQQAVKHLVEIGHTKIGHLAGRLNMNDAIERRDAFVSVMHEYGLPTREDWILETDFSPASGRIGALKLLSMKDRPTAIFCANDEVAAGCYAAAWEMGVSIPDDISIVGFDNAPNASMVLPGLTTVAQPLERMAEDAVVALMEIIDGKTAKSRMYETSLVIRGSTKPCK